MHIPHSFLTSASHIQAMAKQSTNERIAFALTGLSVTLIGLMVYREAKDLLFPKRRELYDRVIAHRHPDEEHFHRHHR